MDVFAKLPLDDIILPQKLNCPFYYQPHPACLLAMEIVKADIAGMEEWKDEIDSGKMFGVLVVEGESGEVGFLKAYSGQIGGRENWEGWVPAVFDYLQSDGYFAVHERAISQVNRDVEAKERSDRHRLNCARLAKAKEAAAKQIEEYRAFMAEAKRLRRLRRDAGEDDAVLVRESQYQKAEMKRLKQRLEDELRPLQNIVDDFEAELLDMKRRRKQMSDDLQRWLFTQFVVRNAKGDCRNLLDIFKGTSQIVPPSGAGECCAPKLLQYAFLHGLKPKAMAEFWWGRSPVGEIRKHLSFYPACYGKCKPILDFMLQGLDVEENPLDGEEHVKELRIVYEDEWLVVADKPAGMLSVPGKAQRASAQDVLSVQLSGIRLFPVHRLDMQTSGLLVFAKTEDVQRVMHKAFATREVKKMYYAVLDGTFRGPKEGYVELPLAADYMNRPRQKVDMEEGKDAVTHYYILDIEGDKTHVKLFPLTGRTHQLRVHCAHPDGLGLSIVGDDLYGVHNVRLMLHAEEIEFLHPVTRAKVCVESKHAF